MLRLAFMAVSLVLFASCNRVNKEYCNDPVHAEEQRCTDVPPPDAPDGDDSGTDGPDSGDGSCRTSADCTADEAKVCDPTPTPHVCVECLPGQAAACMGTSPVCRDRACAACVNDDECGAGGLCLPTGACVPAAAIMHAKPVGLITSACGDAENTACSLTTALATLRPEKTVLKLDEPGVYTPDFQPNTNFVVNNNITIDARGATLHGHVEGPLLTIASGKTVTIFGGTIEDADSGDGITCGNGSIVTIQDTIIDRSGRAGINVAVGCRLTATHAKILNSGLDILVPGIIAAGTSISLSRSTLQNNLGGGISVSLGTFVIVGNAFMKNGNSTTSNATVAISTTQDSINRFEFNTIANNQAQGGRVAGVDCTAGEQFTASNNIIWNNTGPTQFERTCLHIYSVIGPAGMPATGMNNTKEDPRLTGETDPHLQTGSPASSALGAANQQTNVSDDVVKTDIDGDERKRPIDIGADQVPR